MINKIIQGCLEIWKCSSRVQIDIDFNTRREIRANLRAPVYYHLSLHLYLSPPSLHLEEQLGTFATFPCFGDRSTTFGNFWHATATLQSFIIKPVFVHEIYQYHLIMNGTAHYLSLRGAKVPFVVHGISQLKSFKLVLFVKLIKSYRLTIHTPLNPIGS